MEGLIGSVLSPLGWLDPLFRLPFLTGLALACVLPALGALLMLREEWLAAWLTEFTEIVSPVGRMAICWPFTQIPIASLNAL